MLLNAQNLYSSITDQEKVAQTKTKVQKESANFPYCKGNSQFFLQNFYKNYFPIKIEIKTNKVKSWYLNLIRSFYSTPRSNWKIDRDYKKYKSAKIIIEYKNNIKCKFNGKVKIHGGRKDHINLKKLSSSLRVKLYDGHLNHSRHFQGYGVHRHHFL